MKQLCELFWAQQSTLNHPPIITTLFHCLPSPLDSSCQSSVGRQRSAEGGKCLYLTSYLSVPQEFYGGTLPPALRRLLGHWNSFFIQGSDYRVRVLGVISIWNLDLFAQTYGYCQEFRRFGIDELMPQPPWLT